MSKKINLIGRTFNRLTVLKRAGANPRNGNIHWECMCICGGIKIADTQNLRNGITKSCGCLKEERRVKSKKVQRIAKREKEKLLLDNLSIITENGEIRIEKWRNVKGYEANYKVSDFGRVKRVRQTKILNNQWGSITKVQLPQRVNNPHINFTGVPRIILSNGDLKKGFSVSRLVATAFIPNPKNLPNVCHKDDNPANNLSNNLFWGTTQDNVDDKCNKGRQAKGETMGLSILTGNQVVEIRKKYKKGKLTQKDLSKEYHTTQTNISNIILHKSWRHLL